MVVTLLITITDAVRQGNVIQLHPSEVTFEVPEKWRGEKTLFRLTLHERRQKAGRDLMGTQIADAPLSLQDCAAQIDPDHLSWLRAYVVDSTQEEILKRIQKKGWGAAEKIPTYVRGHSAEYQSVPAKEGPWMHMDIPYLLDFGDYSGEGYVSFYMQPAGGRELVIAMGAMWSGEVYKQSDERQNVLKSVVVPDSPAQSDVGQPHHGRTDLSIVTDGFSKCFYGAVAGVKRNEDVCFRAGMDSFLM